MVEAIEAALEDIVDADAHASIQELSKAYQNELQQYHEDVLDLMNESDHSVFMHGGHNAFGYFVQRYNLEYVTPYQGFSTDSEPTPGALANMVETMNEHGAETLFSENLIDPRVADAIAEETGAEIVYLNVAGNISKDDFEEGVTFMEMMHENLEGFKSEFGNHE